jgi:DNA-binding CsgD family transcriptional regulator
VAVVVEPAKSAQIAPIIVEAYCLTPREQQITQAVARGLSNPEIAAGLHLSTHTVRDHLKAVFGKVGVGSRGELVAKLFAEHYRPSLHAAGRRSRTCSTDPRYRCRLRDQLRTTIWLVFPRIFRSRAA